MQGRDARFQRLGRRRAACALGAVCGAAAQAGAQLTEPFPAVFSLESLTPAGGGDGSLGFVLGGLTPRDLAGTAVASAGDVNGDGIDDVVVGARGAGSSCGGGGYGYVTTGRSYIVFGRAGGFAAVIDLLRLTGADGFAFEGLCDSSAAVASAGDVNGDGIADVLVGAAYGGSFGRCAVIFGRDSSAGAAFPPLLGIESLDGTNGFALEGEGRSVGSGDIDGDGLSDVIVGDRLASPPGRQYGGQTFVIPGRDTTSGPPFPPLVPLGSGATFNGVSPLDFSGSSVAGGGDVNGDGVADLVVGAPSADPRGRLEAGSSYIVFGRAGGLPATTELSSLDGATGFRLDGARAGELSGLSVAHAGDINADGIGDVIIGAPLDSAAYVVFGRDTGAGAAFPASIDLASLDGAAGFRLDGAGEGVGRSVSSGGDVNGDGVDDLIIGAPGISSGYYSPPDEAFVVFGRDTRAGGAFPAAIDLAELDGELGFRIEGHGLSSAGASVACAGDVNGDGVDDLIIGAPGTFSSYYHSHPGEAFVIFGRRPDAACYADCDGSGSLDFFDFLCFQNLFAAGDPRADCDESGELDFFDFLCFQNQFAAGCP